MRPHGSPAQLEQRRLHALVLLEQGLAPVDVARHLGVDRRSLRRWKATARHGGPARLKAIPAPGRPPRRGPLQPLAPVRLARGPAAALRRRRPPAPAPTSAVVATAA